MKNHLYALAVPMFLFFSFPFSQDQQSDQYFSGQQNNSLSDKSPLPLASGQVLDFDGTDDWVEVQHHPELNISGDFSVEINVFLKGSNNDLSQSIIDKTERGDAANYRCYIKTNSKKMGFWNGHKNVTSSESIPINQWVSLAWVYNSDIQEMKFYINGVTSGVATIALGQTNNGPLFIGKDNNQKYGKNRNINMKLDELRIWNRVRCHVEVLSNNCASLTGKENGLIAYYPFDQGTANASNFSDASLQDFTGRHNGILRLFSLSGNVSNWVAGENTSTGSCPVQAFVTIGHVPSLGNIDGTYNRSHSLYQPSGMNLDPEDSCYCWTREDGTYSIGNISNGWYLFKSDSCPNDPSSVISGLIGYSNNCDPASLSGIDRCQ